MKDVFGNYVIQKLFEKGMSKKKENTYLIFEYTYNN